MIALVLDAVTVQILPPATAEVARIAGPEFGLAVLIAVRRPALTGIVLLLLLIGALAAGAALVLCVPGAERTRWQRWAPLLVAALWPAALVVTMSAGGNLWAQIADEPVIGACPALIAALAAGPAGLLFRLLRQAAPIERAWIAGLASLSAAALGAAVQQLHCPIDAAAHHLLEHVLPVFVLAAVGAMLGRRGLTRTSRSLRAASS